ncbi:gliding motility lipoprotein GldB [Cardinium endosymbiont of Tipula unca]|uniref:gliding motility lipoprotein GldB n=1 Tax=Cardinium endosymbiont of Tipula unca TaxID=3066216 RepID=UPI0030CEA297
MPERALKRKILFILISLGAMVITSALFSIRKQFIATNDAKECCTIERLEQQLFAANSEAQITALLMEHTLFSQKFLGIQHAQNQDAYQETAKALFVMCKDPSTLEMYEESNQQFQNFSGIEQDLQKAFSRLKSHYSDVKMPKIYTMITGMEQDLYVSNDLIVIGLDFFLGTNPKFKLGHLPKYIADTYDASAIVYKIMLLYTQKFNYENQYDKTMLAEMLYYGKAFFLVKDLLPHLPDHVILGYTPEQLQDLNRHQTTVWGHFIEHKLFYHTNHLIKRKYINPRPFTGEIGPSCPGSIGRWLGWEIVKKYMKQHNSETIQGLMLCTDSQKIFHNSCYRPKDDV